MADVDRALFGISDPSLRAHSAPVLATPLFAAPLRAALEPPAAPTEHAPTAPAAPPGAPFPGGTGTGGGANGSGSAGASTISDAVSSAYLLEANASLVLSTVHDELPSSPVFDTDSTPD